MKIVGVIPARLASTRFPEKVLQLLSGKPLIQHVWERAKQAEGLEEVLVACDDAKVQTCVEGFGGRAIMTRKDHPNGSSRVAEVMGRLDYEAVINIQGDEPFIHPRAIDRLASALRQDETVAIVTLAVKSKDSKSYEDPNVVKVVCDQNHNALYFSRAPIPYRRDKRAGDYTHLKHLGIYGYRKTFLLDYLSWDSGSLEETEKLEQLRILEKGYSIRVLETPYDSIGVDTRDDLEELETMTHQKAKRA